MTATETLTASLEDYLETIFHIIARKQVARPKDIVKQLQVSYASVTGALRVLAQKNLINYSPHEVITLTDEGEKAAKNIVRRHEVLRSFFINVLAVGEKDADETACIMEHSISENVLERFIHFAEFIDICPRGGAKWIARFRHHCNCGVTQEDCEKCISAILEDVKKTKSERPKDMMQMKLKDLKPGKKGKVIKIVSSGETSKRMVEIGLTPGAIAEVERVAPLGDPIDIKVRGYHLSLRKEEADEIEVEPL